MPARISFIDNGSDVGKVLVALMWNLVCTNIKSTERLSALIPKTGGSTKWPFILVSNLHSHSRSRYLFKDPLGHAFQSGKVKLPCMSYPYVEILKPAWGMIS